ncbi:Transcription factor spt8 [Rhizopus azygosporus]|uniref:Transcription factor spt8 n=1 Tax=Rhizopus azygosporus TaxID=86630 RepID=A0A367JQ74_RHIAZ|nr:Transcription factor spt8 [Rhizopus azygosporus]
MSSEDEDIDLNDEVASQVDTITDDGGDIVDMDDPLPSARNSPATSPVQLDADTRQTDLKINSELLSCASYDCVPLVAAIHPYPVFSLAATRNYKWILTGCEDGYIRKWDFFTSMNGKTSLAQALRHQHVESVVYTGVLSSWWENNEQSEDVPGESKLSAAYSLALHSEALWALQGCENGSINLVTVRHDEGKCHHVLRKHTAPVSVLMITPDETGVISGSWDKSVYEWDLNQGAIIRSYDGHSSQLSSAEYQPIYTPEDVDYTWDKKNPNIFLTTSVDGGCFIWDKREKDPRKLPLPNGTPPWCLSACWSADGTKIYVGRRNGTVDEYDYASQKRIRSFRMPANSGPVYSVKSMPNGKQIVCASNDNIRLWDTSIDSAFTIGSEMSDSKLIKTTSTIPFTILPGHHGGAVSQMSINPTCKYMVTASGNRGWEGASTNVCLFYDILPVS